MLSEQLLANPVVAALQSFDAAAILDGNLDYNETTLEVNPENIVAICRHLKHDQKFIRLSGLTGVDWYPAEPRFEVIYLLHSIERNMRVRIKVRLSGKSPEVDSVYSVWKGADWYERETFDLFGIVFRNHPNLTRLMMPEGWEGHPLRKDFPVHGHRYSYVDE